MKREEERIDKLIREALTEEEAAFYDELEEQDLFGKLGSVYKGKLGWLALLMTIVQVLIFAVFIWCLVQFLNAESTEALIKWGAAGFVALMSVTLMKMFIWMQINKNDVLRELKKLEFQLATYIEKAK